MYCRLSLLFGFTKILEAVKQIKRSLQWHNKMHLRTAYLLYFFLTYMGFFVFFFCNRWFDVLQKVSTQLKTNISSAAKHRADKVPVSVFS